MFEQRRKQMVERDLMMRGITDRGTLQAMLRVPVSTPAPAPAPARVRARARNSRPLAIWGLEVLRFLLTKRGGGE